MATATLQLSKVSNCLPRATAPAEKRQECVLLIDDNEDAMLLVRYALQAYGHGRYRLIWANRLSEGLGQLAKDGVDIVLLDLGLPESSGPASYAWVREVSPDVPVVVLTGDESEETKFSVLASGAQDYLVKNQVSGSLLLEAIQVALSANKQRQGPIAMTHKQRFGWVFKDRPDGAT
jgi:DNA-binding response OmpR family regulator